MEYLLGKKEDFWKFVDSISNDDKIGVITHTDLDGISSAIFLEEILNSRNIKIDSLFFISYKKGMFDEILPGLGKKKITKVFLTDMNTDGTDLEEFDRLKNKFSCFVIDHHPVKDISATNVIKTKISDCSGLTIYDLGKGIINEEKWKLILYATMISEMSYKDKDNLNLIKKDYPDINKDNIWNSPPGIVAKKVSSALIYFDNNMMKIYNLIKNNDLKEFEKAQEIIDSEIDIWKKDFKKNSEYYPDKNMYIYYFEPRYNISSIFSTILSLDEPDKTFVIIAPGKSKLRLSARNQGGKEDMSALLKKGIYGLSDAVAGGHVPASGGQIKREDLNKFKENLLK